MKEIELTSPLDAAWSKQYVRLHLKGAEPGEPLELWIGGCPHPFQYTGQRRDGAAEVVVKMAFEQGESKTLRFLPARVGSTSLDRVEIPLEKEAEIGFGGAVLRVARDFPFAAFAGNRMEGRLICETDLRGARLVRRGDGPLFADFELTYDFGPGRTYEISLRCYKNDPWVEVSEAFSLGMDAGISWTINPGNRFTHILSRDSFIDETQPTLEPLGAEHPRDILCRLQMPVLTEYFIPNNRGWFAFCDPARPELGITGILGLYGQKWEEPVANMPLVLDAGGSVEWRASLVSGTRHWLLLHAPLETEFTSERRFLFHCLHAEFNALRLDEHFDLSGREMFDASGAEVPGVIPAGDFREMARRNVAGIPGLKKYADGVRAKTARDFYEQLFLYLLEPSNDGAQWLRAQIEERLVRWVRQFQGFREGRHDYAKAVIGFSRALRRLLVGYELLLRDGMLDEATRRKFNAWFVFAARRILDEGRWPHSRTWKHPDHPESVRDFYTYGGEHKPDRLVWTNSLPNFQSDPLCALIHLSAVLKDHPDSRHWLRFGLDDIERQLDAYCGPSGAWEESINYTLYTLGYFVTTFKILKARWGIDYFHDERVRRLVGWLCRFFGPHDKRIGSYAWPPVGNSVAPQNETHILLAFASELKPGDPLRDDVFAIFRCVENNLNLRELHGFLLALSAPADLAGSTAELRPLGSEVMAEVGVAMRHEHPGPRESYLFQKIGFAKDHYENDETAFNWHAKGTPFTMDYATYSAEAAAAAAHNLVEIPDMDSLRRGWLADSVFTPELDYTRSEVPVTMKLLWGRVRSFEEIDGGQKNGAWEGRESPYYYIGDPNPTGPRVWKVRQLFFVKPDYVVVFDRVFGRVPHRWNLHFTGEDIRREGAELQAKGRFDLDLLVHVAHPSEFIFESGKFVPRQRPGTTLDPALQAQSFCRILNGQDGIYRALVFAKERERSVRITRLGGTGLCVETEEYTDVLFLGDEFVNERAGEVRFSGRAGWMRRAADGRIWACVPNGESLAAFGWQISGRGPWAFNPETGTRILAGPPRELRVDQTPFSAK